jgi:alkylation response protein AidB-like acyl-CoA dehydrogenase
MAKTKPHDDADRVPSIDRLATTSDDEELERTTYARHLQRRLFDAGLAGICIPKDYGGQGLTPAHQSAFNEEIDGYEMPGELQVPTMTPCAAIILDFGTEEQKRRHIPPILRGEEVWVQMLSEPSGGSDVAGALTSAVREGNDWIVNGSKIWTSGAWKSDWGLALARTNWDVPKHQGLTVFMIKIHQPGVEIHRIEMLTGSREFCQEFLTDVRISDSDRIGAVDDGWTIGVRWMYHERAAKGGGSPYVSRPVSYGRSAAANHGVGANMLHLAERNKQLDDAHSRQLVGEAHAVTLVGRELTLRIAEGISLGIFSDQAAAIARLYSGAMEVRNSTIAFELARSGAVAWNDADETLGDRGMSFLMRQRHTIGGGTTEMSRNAISERVLGFPREPTPDKDRPFRNVQTNTR